MTATKTRTVTRTLSYQRFDFTLGALTIRVGDRVRRYEVSRRGDVVRLLKTDASAVYTVRGGRCDCKAGRYRGACVHAAACLSDRGHFGKAVA